MMCTYIYPINKVIIGLPFFEKLSAGLFSYLISLSPTAWVDYHCISCAETQSIDKQHLYPVNTLEIKE